MKLKDQYNIIKKKKAVYKILYPQKLRDRYRIFIVKLVMEYKKHFVKLIYPHLSELKNKYKADSWYDDLETLMRAINFEFSRNWTPQEISKFVKTHGKTISDWNKKEMDKYFKTVMDMPVYFQDAGLDKLLGEWTHENVKRITNLIDRTAGEVEEVLIQDIKAGETIETIKDNLMGTELESGPFSKLESRAELIARDQVGKLYAATTEKRQTDLGIDKYIWQTAEDERVRESHAERDGKEFSWNDPPEGGHPGEDFQCRCVAIPIIPE